MRRSGVAEDALSMEAVVILTADMRAVVRAASLCFAATVTPDGRPNLSPKGTIRVWDDSHLFFLDLASPKTRANLAVNPWMEINVVDQLSRRGYRFLGRASVHCDDDVFRQASKIAPEYEVASVILLDVEHAEPLVSPAYQHTPNELAMRASWKERRRGLDEEFEAHIAEHGEFVV